MLLLSFCICLFPRPGTPSVTPSDPCRGSSWGNVLNPCGKFTCSKDQNDSTTNTCDCKPPFVLVSNTDGSRTCVHSECILQCEKACSSKECLYQCNVSSLKTHPLVLCASSMHCASRFLRFIRKPSFIAPSAKVISTVNSVALLAKQNSCAIFLCLAKPSTRLGIGNGFIVNQCYI